MPKIDPDCIVNSHTEWDPLEEVIVGRVDDATIPEWHVSGKAVWPSKHWKMYKEHAGESFPKELVNKGEQNDPREFRARSKFHPAYAGHDDETQHLAGHDNELFAPLRNGI